MSLHGPKNLKPEDVPAIPTSTPEVEFPTEAQATSNGATDAMATVTTLEPQTLQIQKLNDQLRTTASQALGQYGKIVLTRSIADLPIQDLRPIIKAVEEFNAFTKSNDPWGEHDCAMFSVGGKPFMWKIDYYDKTMENGSEAPWDPEQTTRVLTVMRPEER